MFWTVSIPQAVGTIAICNIHGANSASLPVSIPQAVGTIAMALMPELLKEDAQFQYRKR